MIGFVGSMAHEVRILDLYANVEGASTRWIIRIGAAATSMIGEYCKFKVRVGECCDNLFNLKVFVFLGGGYLVF